MKQSNDILAKSLDTLKTIKKERERLDYILYTLNLLLGAEKTLFFSKQQIPKRGLARLAWQDRTPFFINDLKKDEHFNPRYDNYCEHIYAVLYYPVEHNGSYTGMVIAIGKEGYETTQDQIVPLRSAEQTIGVTVKQATVNVPPHNFTQDDIELLGHAIASLFDTHYAMIDPHVPVAQHETNATVTEQETQTDTKETDITDHQGKNSLIETTVKKVKQLFVSKH